MANKRKKERKKERGQTKQYQKMNARKPLLDGLGLSKTWGRFHLQRETGECLIWNSLELRARDEWRFVISHMKNAVFATYFLDKNSLGT